MGLGTYGDTRLNPLVGTTPGLLKNYKNKNWVFYDPRVTAAFDFTFPVGSAPDGSIRGRLIDEGLIAAEEPRVIQQGAPYPPAGNNPGDPSRKMKYNSAGQYAFSDAESLVSESVEDWPNDTLVTLFKTRIVGDCFFVISKNGAYLQTNGLIRETNPYDLLRSGETLLDGEAPIGFPADAFDNLTLEGLFLLGDSNAGRDQRPPTTGVQELNDAGARGLGVDVSFIPAGDPNAYLHEQITMTLYDLYGEIANPLLEYAQQSIFVGAYLKDGTIVTHTDLDLVQAGSVSYPLRSVFDPNEYVHVALVKSGREVFIYTNGSLAKTATLPAVTTDSLLDYFVVVRLITTSYCNTVNYVQYNGKPRIKNFRFCSKALYSGSTISPEEEPLTLAILERLNIK